MAGSRVRKCQPFIWEESLGLLLQKSSLRNWLPRIHFTMLSRLSTQWPLQPWFKRAWLLLPVTTDLYHTIHVILVLVAYRMQELCTHENFYPGFREGLGSQPKCPGEAGAWICVNEAEGAVENLGSQRYQEYGTSAKESWMLVTSRAILRGGSCGLQLIKPKGWALPSLKLTSHHCVPQIQTWTYRT